MSSKEQTTVEITDTTTKIAEIVTAEKQPTEISEPVVSAKPIQPTTDAETNNDNKDSNSFAPTSSKSKKKFVVGTEESGENNDSTSENGTNSKEVTENNIDTKLWSGQTEEIVKVEEEKREPQQPQQKQEIEGDKKEPKEYVNISNTQEVPATSNSEPQLPPTPKEDKVHETSLSESSKPTTMTPTEAHQAAPVVTNTTVTATTQGQRTLLRTPAESPESTPISSPSDDIHNASCVNPSIFKIVSNSSGQNQIQPNNIIDNYNVLPDESYTPETLNYPHQPRFPPSSNGISRTQQKLLLQRQHFLADDENYLIHPRNQLRLTKVIERINREHAAILLHRDPIIESLQRVWPKYVQDHPEVMDDDFGVGYEDAKEWGVISDHGKDVGHIGTNSIISTETLGVDSMPLRGIK
jgi:hypothetical protein